MPAADEGRRLAGQQLPESLELAIAHIEELGGIIAARYADHMGRVHPSRIDRVALEVAGCNEAIDAIRAEHAQRVTLQRQVLVLQQQLAVLQVCLDSHQRDLADPPGYLQDAVICAAGLEERRARGV